MKQVRLFSIIFYLLLIAISCSNSSKSATNENLLADSAPLKGVWVTNVASEALVSRDNIKETILICKESGITDIYVVTWNRAYTLYPSKVMEDRFGVSIMEEYNGRDPLQEIIEEGHAQGLKVHAWFEFGFSCSYKDPEGGHIIQKYPDWKAIDYDGNLVTKNGFQWMNAINPEVQDFVKSLLLEVATNYNVDGIQGDDRLPAMPSIGGYDAYTIELYKKEHNGQLPPKNEKDSLWLDWRANKLTDFLGGLYKEIKAINPNLIVSMAPSIHPWAKEEYLQDWPTWLNKGYCDYVIPQIYRYTIDNYTKTLKAQLSYLDEKQADKFYSGVLLQVDNINPSQGFLDSMIVTNRANGVKGESFFFYEGLKKYRDYFTKEYPNK